jgi:hypothetical protein
MILAFAILCLQTYDFIALEVGAVLYHFDHRFTGCDL